MLVDAAPVAVFRPRRSKLTVPRSRLNKLTVPPTIPDAPADYIIWSLGHLDSPLSR